MEDDIRHMTTEEFLSLYSGIDIADEETFISFMSAIEESKNAKVNPVKLSRPVKEADDNWIKEYLSDWDNTYYLYK